MRGGGCRRRGVRFGRGCLGCVVEGGDDVRGWVISWGFWVGILMMMIMISLAFVCLIYTLVK